MKFTVSMKCPDALERAIELEAEGLVGGSSDDEEADERYSELVRTAMEYAEKWFRYGEIVTLEIDSDKDTCTVIPAR